MAVCNNAWLHFCMILITTDTIGGVWSYSLALAGALGERCMIVTVGPPASPQQRQAAGRVPGCTLRETGLPLDWLSPTPALLAQTAATLAGLANREGATSAHLHAPCLATADWTIPIVATAHSCMATWWAAVRTGAPPPDFAWHAAATRAGLLHAARVIAPSHAFASLLRRTYSLTRPIDIIHNGHPPAPESTVAREPFILTAGRLWDEAKNIAVLDQAAAGLQTPIHAAGPLASPNGDAYEPMHLHAPGTLAPDALRALMARASIFAAPSLYEPFGLAVLEAAQTGAPLVLADIPTFRELWTGAALFVPATDPAAWATALAALMANPTARADLGQAASTRAATYTEHAMARATAALHAGLTHNSRAA